MITRTITVSVGRCVQKPPETPFSSIGNDLISRLFSLLRLQMRHVTTAARLHTVIPHIRSLRRLTKARRLSERESLLFFLNFISITLKK